ncbi:hypothetical protein [Comamonas sp. NoAH]|uniref:hypothetical protein n=1 Tax=Comamonas halotolerans TaxID=3041496 RepID=UPI0024E13E4B|nr:hypothetical protein [Comamonas sp. NoAH]
MASFIPPKKTPQVPQQNWPLQLGQPLTEPKYSQQQSKCNKRQIGSEPKPSPNEQMH